MSLAWMTWPGSVVLASRICFLLTGAVVRGGILLVLAAIVVFLWPRASAAQRHVVWAVTCCSLLLLPVLAVIVPAWHVSVRVPVVSATFAPREDRRHGADQSKLAADPVAKAVSAGSRATIRAVDMTISQPLPELGWLLVYLSVWGSGALIVLTVLLDNQRRARRLVSEALPLTDVGMLAVFVQARSTAQVTRVVSVKLHASTVPIVYGVFRPTVVLPTSARTWNEDRLYNILVHELAHIKRHDCLIQTVAFLACAVYWCNPLVWLAVRRLQTEQEQACDDVVLTMGNRSRTYATDLLELTQAFQPTRVLSLAGLPFARPSELQTRLQSIIDQSRHRRLLSRRGALAIWGTGLGVISPLAGLTPQLRYAEVRPPTSPVEQRKQRKMNAIPQITRASATARPLATVSRQVQAVTRTDSPTSFQDENYLFTKLDLSKVEDDGIRYRHTTILFAPMVDTRYHFIVVDGDNGRVVFNSKQDGMACFPTEFLRNTVRDYYDEPSHTRITGVIYRDEPGWPRRPAWDPKYVNFSMVFHSKDKAHAIALENCSWIKKGAGYDETHQLIGDSTAALPYPSDKEIRQRWVPQDTVR